MDIDGKARSDSSGNDILNEYATRRCLDCSYGDSGDWFLPSKDELNLVYTNLHKNELSAFANKNY